MFELRSMINSKRYENKSNNIGHLLHDRMLYTDFGSQVRRRLQASPPFLQRLELDSVLKGHEGCVNCLEWSSCGRILASGSDDFHLILWNPFAQKIVRKILTKHTGNMFSVKFMPKFNNLIATAAADKKILIFDINASESLYTCECHSSRVKRLATAPDSPYIFWSAGEDGIVLQLDHREKHICNSANNRLINLTSFIDANAEAKCIAVNPIRTEYIAVGANDPYARIYDRRMLKTFSTAANDSPEADGRPKESVTYYCPGHISQNNAKRMEHESRAITYLTFNATGTELLVNMGAEHIYIYDLINAEQPVFLNLPEYKTTINNTDNNADGAGATATPQNQTHSRRKLPEQIEEYKKWGNEFLENEKYYLAIRTYSDAIRLASFGSPVLYLNRATAYMRRQWYGDIYAALRDCHTALRLDPAYVKAHFRLARSLLELGRPQDADECLKELIRRFPSYANNHGVLMLNKDIRENCQTNSSSSQQHEQFAVADFLARGEMTDEEFNWRCKAKDYKERLLGHCNTTTDIKEANYFGNEGQFIVAGSDDGNFFIWERKSGNIHSIYKADSAIVNCVLPHAELCLMATSGIDHDIKIWSPMKENERPNFIDPLGRCVEENQMKMRTDPFAISNRNAFCWNG
ncbi:WD and tetratricopeptide repeats protein 1 isoform X1 [Stomoxys calcitrans]|uniref:WD and tetratricopeptide repeats protein 1 isoform X1 n=2 Tax=Stomoxys calcitrans TaxID=35570 RepID=UPI0027E22D37|nr:WD and tetratricopeptide repeats protein 1 isoform X1 [Stomoxys calcitrans]